MNSWDSFVDNMVVVDTNSFFLYIGKIEKVDDEFVVLTDVDCHDSSQTQTTKEKYLNDIKKCGIKSNRKRIFVRKQFIISISKLEDIQEY